MLIHGIINGCGCGGADAVAVVIVIVAKKGDCMRGGKSDEMR